MSLEEPPPGLDEQAIEAQNKAAFLMDLRARGILDLGLLRALENVPREIFVPHRFADDAPAHRTDRAQRRRGHRRDPGLPLPAAGASAGRSIGALKRPGLIARKYNFVRFFVNIRSSLNRPLT